MDEKSIGCDMDGWIDVSLRKEKESNPVVILSIRLDTIVGVADYSPIDGGIGCFVFVSWNNKSYMLDESKSSFMSRLQCEIQKIH